MQNALLSFLLSFYNKNLGLNLLIESFLYSSMLFTFRLCTEPVCVLQVMGLSRWRAIRQMTA